MAGNRDFLVRAAQARFRSDTSGYLATPPSPNFSNPRNAGFGASPEQPVAGYRDPIYDLLDDLGLGLSGSPGLTDLPDLTGIDRFGLAPGSDVSFVPPGGEGKEATEDPDAGQTRETAGQGTPDDKRWVVVETNSWSEANGDTTTNWIVEGGSNHSGDFERRSVTQTRDSNGNIQGPTTDVPAVRTPDPLADGPISSGNLARGLRNAKVDYPGGISPRGPVDGPGMIGPVNRDTGPATPSGFQMRQPGDIGFWDPTFDQDWTRPSAMALEGGLRGPGSAVDETGMVGPLPSRNPGTGGSVPGSGWSPRGR